MKLRSALLARSSGPRLRPLLGVAVAASVALAPLPTLAAPPAEGEAPAAADAEEIGGVVALLKFDGDPGDELRFAVQSGLTDAGYEVSAIRVGPAEAAKKVKCKELDEGCRGKVAKYLAKNSKKELRFYVYGVVTPGNGGTAKIVVYDIAKDATVKEFNYVQSDDDFIVALSLPKAIGAAVNDYQSPRPAMTAEEQAIIDTLDEPAKTAEEIAEEERALKKAAEDARKGFNSGFDAGEQSVDLRADFKDFCRTGPREDKIIENEDGTTDKERDMRPVCKRGPFFGYWQPRAWVALGLTVGTAGAMGVMYGLALAARSEWSSAKDDLDSAIANGTASATDPNVNNNQYADLAGAVSESGKKVQRRAIVGDVFLGATVLLGGVLGVIIYQDRSQAKDWMAREKELRLSDVRVGPMMTEGGGGAAASFRF